MYELPQFIFTRLSKQLHNIYEHNIKPNDKQCQREYK